MARITRKQSSIENLVQDLTSLRAADALATTERGNLSTLTTLSKSDLVHAINEVNAESDVNRALVDASNTKLGSTVVSGNVVYTTLTTTAQTVIGGINELKTGLTTLDGLALKKADNLASLADKATSRTNLDVYNKSEVQGLINTAALNLGTNYTVANIAARNALTGLTIGDNVFVRDNGDTKWAIYKVTAMVGTTPTFDVIMDQDVYLNSISAASIKAAYESNPDTNAFTNAQKTKVSYLSVTSAIDLDKVIQSDELITDANLASVSNTTLASSLAVKSYIDNKTLKKTNNLSDLTDKAAARTTLDVYNKTETEQLLLNAAFGGITVSDLTNMAADIEKAKKNYFFGLDLLGPLR